MGRFRGGYPRHLGKPDGRGYVACARTGFLRKPGQLIEDNGHWVARDHADITPGFGTRHPQDVNQAEIGGDPTPLERVQPPPPALSKRELGISDAEIMAAIRESRPPRPGF
jgi:hypothetical protein